MTNPLDIAKQTLEQRKQFAESLRILLEEAKNTNMEKLLVTKVDNLRYTSYVGAVSFKQFASIGRFAHTLDWFTNKTIKNKLGEDVAVIRDDRDIKNEDLITQRPINYPRQRDLVHYLLSYEDNDAKFPPITAVVLSSDSMKKENAKFYNADGKAVRNSISFSPLDTKGDIGFLDISEEYVVYALDGQHRLLAFNGLVDLWNSSDKSLKAKNSSGVPVNNEEKIIRLEEYGFDNDSFVQDILNQKVVVEFIPGVYKGETFLDSISRVRSHFIDYNDKSEKLKKQDIAPIDDRDPFIKFAKYAVAESEFLGKKEIFTSVKAAPSRGSAFLLTLVNLRQMVSIIFRDKEQKTEKGKGTSWYGKGSVKVEKELDMYIPLFLGLINSISNLSDIKSYLETPKVPGTTAKNFRSLSYQNKQWKGTIKDEEGSIIDNDKGHVLFTTVGLMALSYAYKNLVVGTLDDDENQPSLSKDEFIKRLKKFEQSGEGFDYEKDKNSEVSVGLRHISLPQSIFYGVLFEISKEKMIVREPSVKLAGELLTYILGDGDFENKEKLQQTLTSNRTVRDIYYDWDGTPIKIEISDGKVRNPIKLPPRI